MAVVVICIAASFIAIRAAIIVVTHDEKIIPTFRRIYQIRDGRTYETLH